MMKLLGNVVAINNFREIEDSKSLLELPQDMYKRVGVCKGTITHTGTQSDIPELIVGVDVLVPNHFGTTLQDGSKIYNTEDILAIVGL